MTQERRQDERRRRRLARQQQKRQGRPVRVDGPVNDIEFGGVMGWFQRNTKWVFLAVIILFQSDIKRGLATAGVRLFPSFKGKPDTGATEEIIRASFQMASRRIGALIALEREASLDDYADAGQRLEARVSGDLLMAIFHPTSPLHDGAVVVQQGRLVAAKVFLPLSLSREVSRFYGTRHRAAIGLTEETDAVVIIVSEERGTVGVAVAGEVIPVADTNELRLRLLDFFQADGRRPVVSPA